MRKAAAWSVRMASAFFFALAAGVAAYSANEIFQGDARMGWIVLATVPIHVLVAFLIRKHMLELLRPLAGSPLPPQESPLPVRQSLRR